MRVVLIAGKAEHGKDFTAGVIKEMLEQKEKRVLVTHYADLLKFVCTNFFNWDGHKDEAGRALLQRVGTDVVRKQDPHFWVDIMMKLLNMLRNEFDFVIISDCRFPNEITVPKGMFRCITIKVNRPGYTGSLTEGQLNHVSETALDDWEFDWVLTNDGTKNYTREIKKLVECGFGEEGE